MIKGSIKVNMQLLKLDEDSALGEFSLLKGRRWRNELPKHPNQVQAATFGKLSNHCCSSQAMAAAGFFQGCSRFSMSVNPKGTKALQIGIRRLSEIENCNNEWT